MERLPGMTVETSENNAEKILEMLFSSGGLFLSQVCNVTGVEMHTVQNWVKRGFVSPPQKKLYSKRQVCRIAIINMLHTVLPLDTALNLLRYINGNLDDESDDMIDDSVLYIIFCKIALDGSVNGENIKTAIKNSVSQIENPIVKSRTEAVLEAMYCAYRAAKYKQRAERIILSAE